MAAVPCPAASPLPLNITKQEAADPVEHDKEASKILMLCDLPKAVLRRSEGQSEFKLLLNSSD